MQNENSKQVQDLQKRIEILEAALLRGNIPFQLQENLWSVVTKRLLDNALVLGIGTSNPTRSAIVDIASTNKAFRLPCMTSAQRDAITNPKEGMLVYNTTDHRLDDYNGTVWAGV